MQEVAKEVVKDSSLNGSDRYTHVVTLNTTSDSTFKVTVTRHNNWGVGRHDIHSIEKNSLNDAKEIYNFYLEQLKENQK